MAAIAQRLDDASRERTVRAIERAWRAREQNRDARVGRQRLAVAHDVRVEKDAPRYFGDARRREERDNRRHGDANHRVLAFQRRRRDVRQAPDRARTRLVRVLVLLGLRARRADHLQVTGGAVHGAEARRGAARGACRGHRGGRDGSGRSDSTPADRSDAQTPASGPDPRRRGARAPRAPRCTRATRGRTSRRARAEDCGDECRARRSRHRSFVSRSFDVSSDAIFILQKRPASQKRRSR